MASSSTHRIHDILEYGDAAVALAQEPAVTTELRLRLALERALFLVGEAAAGLDEQTRQRYDQPWPAIVGLRNVLAHQYDAVRPEMLVALCNKELPALLAALRS